MNDTKNTLNEIINNQIEWADRRGVAFDGRNVCRILDGNLFAPLNPDTAVEFGGGAGKELGTRDTPGSMASLRSSSALAVNVFDAWRVTDLAPLASLFAADRWADRLRFEVQYPTGLQGISPHLDVVIDQPGCVPLAIESKFTEVYSPPHNEFRDSYFTRPGLWDGFSRLHALASGIADGSVEFDHLGAAQLIKHALGLKNAYGPMGFRLLYLWYEWPSETAEKHREEIDRFSSVAQQNLEFYAMTYQDLFERLKTVEEPADGYMRYLKDRYFAGQ